MRVDEDIFPGNTGNLFGEGEGSESLDYFSVSARKNYFISGQGNIVWVEIDPRTLLPFSPMPLSYVLNVAGGEDGRGPGGAGYEAGAVGRGNRGREHVLPRQWLCFHR